MQQWAMTYQIRAGSDNRSTHNKSAMTVWICDNSVIGISISACLAKLGRHSIHSLHQINQSLPFTMSTITNAVYHRYLFARVWRSCISVSVSLDHISHWLYNNGFGCSLQVYSWTPVCIDRSSVDSCGGLRATRPLLKQVKNDPVSFVIDISPS